MKNFEQRIQNLSSDRQEQFRRLLKIRRSASKISQKIPRRVASRSYPPSFAQQRLWFLHQLEPTVPMYNMPRALHIQGKLDIQALRQALKALIGRHETLRTIFTIVNGEPVATILSHWSFELPFHDVSHLSEMRGESEVQRLIQQEVRRPFDLEHDLMLRGLLFRIHATEHILLLVKHHIATDAWSSGILNREFGLLYNGFAQGSFVTLPDLPITYADFAVWQREWLQEEQLHTLLTYWKQQLDHVPRLELPTDHPRPVIQSYRSSSQSCRLSEHLFGAVATLSRKEGNTVFMTLLTVFTVLLSRYTGQTDIAIGAPIANRRRQELEGLVGFFVNTLVLRIDLSGNPSFQELLQRVRTITLEAYDHQDLPFERLVEELAVERNLNTHPLFQVLFDFVNTPAADLHLSGMKVEPFPVERETIGFDLILYIRRTGENLSVECVYMADVFEASTITRLLEHFQVLLEGLVTSPAKRISELPVLTDTERHQLLVEWNETRTEFPQNTGIHQLFEAEAKRSPEAIALVYDDQQVTYRNLNAKANQLAHYLKKYGVGPDVCVGMYGERSIEMMVGILGVLKAGGAYVPLDPAYPKERLRFMLEDTHLRVLVTQSQFVGELVFQETQIICVDTDWEDISPESDTNLPHVTTLHHLAYVIYTSGSTGTPKGVMLEHRPLVNLIHWYLSRFPRKCGILQFASLSFDVSVYELFAAWCSGGTVFILPKHLRQVPEGLLQFLITHPIHHIVLPVVMLQQVAEIAQNHPLSGVDVTEVISTGEQFQITRPLMKLFDHLDHSSLHNCYGLSETQNVTFFTFPSSSDSWSSYPPIGRPIANTRMYILDAHLQPVPRGVAGEVYIGGQGLARGYVYRADETAERFIPDPFADVPGERLYKTGDLARYLPDGNIEFLGRLDHQLKIRGFRIELGEIEAVLDQHPSLRETVVMVREDTPGIKRLVAYVVSLQESTLTVSHLRQFLRQKLPEHMIPSNFVFLDELPLTPNGKIDRKALPEPEHTRPELEEQFIPPRTPVEEVLARIWCDVLHLDRLGIHDNFFALGGHSLLATQVISRITNTLGLELPLRSLFETPTIVELAVAIAQKQLEKNTPDEIERLLTELENTSNG